MEQEESQFMGKNLKMKTLNLRFVLQLFVLSMAICLEEIDWYSAESIHLLPYACVQVSY